MIITNLHMAKFVDRPNRFTVNFQDNSGIQLAHLRDPGRLKELLIPGVSLLVRPAIHPEQRKTKYDIIAVKSGDIWVLINSGFHSDLAAELIESGFIKELIDYDISKREFSFGKSRLDFLLSKNEISLLLEVKGCTLVEEGHARFPDAPTERGRRHLEELIKAKKSNFEAAVIFIIPRSDAEIFSPNWEMDPDFSDALKNAQMNGVKIWACSFDTTFFKNKLVLNPLKKVELKIRP